MSYSELRSIYARASLSLNLHPPYFDFHERINDALVQECPVATPKTEWLQESFSFDTDLIALPKSPDQAPVWMDGLLSDPQKLAEIGRNGESIVSKHFGRQLPVDHFLEVLEQSHGLKR